MTPPSSDFVAHNHCTESQLSLSSSGCCQTNLISFVWSLSPRKNAGMREKFTIGGD